MLGRAMTLGSEEWEYTGVLGLVFAWRSVHRGIVPFRHYSSYVLLGIINVLLSVYTASSFVRTLPFVNFNVQSKFSEVFCSITRDIGILGSGGIG